MFQKDNLEGMSITLLFCITVCIIISIIAFYGIDYVNTSISHERAARGNKYSCSEKCTHVMAKHAYGMYKSVNDEIHDLDKLGYIIIDVKCYINRSGREEWIILYRNGQVK